MPGVKGAGEADGKRQARRLKTKWESRFGESVTALAWSDDDRHLVVGTADGGMHWIEVESRGESVAHVPAHAVGISALEWLPGTDRFGSLAEDGVVSLWRMGEVTPCWQMSEGAKWGGSLALPRGGPRGSSTRLAFALGKRIHWVDGTGQHLASTEDMAHTIEQLSWPQAEGPVAGCGYGGFVLWDPESGGMLRHIEWPGTFWTVSLSPDGRWLVGGNQERQVHVWELASDEHFHMPGYPGKARQLTWTRDAAWLVTASGMDVICWPCDGSGPAGRKPRLFAAHSETVSCVAVQPDEHVLVSGGEDGRLILWNLDADEEEELLGALTGEAPITCLRWSNDGTVLAVGNRAGELWVM